MDKSALLTNRVTTQTAQVAIEGVGEVTVRGLSRYEMLMVSKGDQSDPLVMERKMLSLAMVDPPMSEKDVEEWQKCSPPAEINAVATAVNELSGVGEGAGKS